MLKKQGNSLFEIRPKILRNYFDLQFFTLRQILKQKQDKSLEFETILDFGSGKEDYRPFFKNVKVYDSLDLYTQGAKYKSLEEIEESQIYDLVLLFDVLEHIENPVDLLCRLKDKLKENGKVWINVPFSARVHPCPYDYLRWTPLGLEFLIKKAQFQLDKMIVRGNNYSTIIQKVNVFFANYFPWSIPLFILSFFFTLLALLSIKYPFFLKDNNDPLGYFLVLRKTKS